MTCAQFDHWLDAYVEGGLESGRRAEMDAHLAECAACRAHANEMRSVLAAATALPRSILPPHDLWPGISARLPARQLAPSARPGAWIRWGSLAAAAVVLVTATAVITYRTVRPAVLTSAAPTPVPPSIVGFAADRDYVLAAEDLERVLAEGRAKMSPSTVALLERNLAVIDSAIAEARAALEADPANADLRALLWGAHRQKLDLLDRATRLTRS